MKILITDSLFIGKEHEEQLKNAGFEVERLDTPHASEAELLQVIEGKDGYILGGIEKLSNTIIDAADKLKAIVFTGIGYKEYIPNHEYVTKKGIAIANTPDGPTHAVAEWAITMSLIMNRNIFDLGSVGDKKFITSKGIENQKIGIIGLGRIGSEIAKMIQPFGPASVSYFSNNKREDSGILYKELDLLLQESDILFVCVSKDAGKDFIGKRELGLMKDGALVVNFIAEGIINQDALFKEINSGRIRAVSDYPLGQGEYNSLPYSHYYCFNASNAFNTEAAVKRTSDRATEAIINLLNTGKDKNRVN